MSGTAQPSYTPNYFSLGDILATQERVPCVVDTELHNLGFLDPGADSQHLAPGTRLEIPFWMMEGMRASKQYLSMELPKTYKEVYREISFADPLVLDLHKLGPHYYEFGRYLMKHSSQEGEDIGTSISKCFMARFLKIMDSAQNCGDGDTLKETTKMDELEKSLFALGRKTKRAMDSWSRRKTSEIVTSNMVTSFKKRKAEHLSS